MSFCVYNLQANRTKKNLENLAKAFGFNMEEESNRAINRIQLRIKPSELRLLREKYQQYKRGRKGYSFTRYILDVCLAHGIHPTKQTKPLELVVLLKWILEELSKQGNNINQAAKKMNAIPDNKVIFNESQNLKRYLIQNQPLINQLKNVLEQLS